MQKPQEIEDRPRELAVTRVAAVDVAKASGVVCTRVPREGEPGRFVTRVWPVEATRALDVSSSAAEHAALTAVEIAVMQPLRRPQPLPWFPAAI